MKIEKGLFDHMVLQRGPKNASEAEFSGICSASGSVTVSVEKGGKTLKGFKGLRAGKASKGCFRGCLSGLPAGGPYAIEIAVGSERIRVKDVLVGDVWLLGGQSNMQGCGLFPRKRLPSNRLVRAFYMDDRWDVAADPVHNMWECVDQAHIDICGGSRPAKPDPDWGVSPGPAFGDEMQRLTGVPQGLIACAHGGTSMTQWDPARKGEGTRSLYGALVRRLVKNGGKVAGIVWYQGCSDANPDNSKLYTQRMRELVSSLRRDCKDRNLPVAIVQISRVVGWDLKMAPHWNSIQDQQRLLPKVIKRLATVPAIDLPLDDLIHISGEGQYVLGRRLARAMQVIREGRRAGLPPIELKKVGTEVSRGLLVAVAEFSNVVGKLQSGSRPSGFSIVNESGDDCRFDISLEGCRARIRSTMSPDMMQMAKLHYGQGFDPYCNITDEAGRPLPVFGPVDLVKPRAATPFIRDLNVSGFLPSADRLAGLEYPKNLSSIKMEKRSFPAIFCNLHQEISSRMGRDELVFFACGFECSEKMTLTMLLGYDGPVKAWIDGREAIYDPKGTNPAVPSKSKARFEASRGSHEILVALDINRGAAWGIYLQLERNDVWRSQLLKGSGHYVLPEIK